MSDQIVSRAGYARVRRLLGRAAVEYRMIRPGDRVLAGFSGGADSLVMCHALHDLRRHAPVPFGIVVATFDPVFPHFNAAGMAEYCRSQGWEHVLVSAPVAEVIAGQGAEAAERPCALCSRLRRGFLHRAADEHGCGVLALGHNLDDLCASLLMNLCHGAGLKTMGPNVPADGGSKRLIRPLCLAPKELIRTAAGLFDFTPGGECVYRERVAGEGDRAFFEGWLRQLEGRFPHLRQAMLKSMSDLRPEHLLDPGFMPAVEAASRGLDGVIRSWSG